MFPLNRGEFLKGAIVFDALDTQFGRHFFGYR
jgi:hypothetical protein